MRVLVLGGTGWLGGQVAVAALEAGHEVTCLARGQSGTSPDGVRFIAADRDRLDAYDPVASQPWDGIVDVARQPRHVVGAVAALGPAAQRWAFVSTGNVYRSHARIGDDETADLLGPLTSDVMASMEEYGAAKVACEQAVLSALGSRAVLARAGLIGGPGDESGRSGYWPWRFAHPSNDAGSVLVPQASIETSLIDARDLSRWLIECLEGRHPTGVYDAIANRATLPDYLAVARSVAGHDGETVPAADDWLVEHGVAEWTGPKSLPWWLADPDWRGFAGRRGDKVLAAGLNPRPLADTLRDALAWEEERPMPGPHGAGLTDEEERDLLRLIG